MLNDRDDDLELVGTQLLDGELGLILPGDEDVADATLDERRRRAAGAESSTATFL